MGRPRTARTPSETSAVRGCRSSTTSWMRAAEAQDLAHDRPREAVRPVRRTKGECVDVDPERHKETEAPQETPAVVPRHGEQQPDPKDEVGQGNQAKQRQPARAADRPQ